MIKNLKLFGFDVNTLYICMPNLIIKKIRVIYYRIRLDICLQNDFCR